MRRGEGRRVGRSEGGGGSVDSNIQIDRNKIDPYRGAEQRQCQLSRISTLEMKHGGIL